MTAPAHVLRQRRWTEAELRRVGFRYYEPQKRVVMARVIQEQQDIELTLEVLTADAGDVICYYGGDEVHDDLDDYEHWPVQRDLFRRNYRPWTDPNWRPNAAERHLMLYGCRPFYKAIGVWALKLRRSIYVESLESQEPVLVPPGRWLCIGTDGEPYHMSDESFRERYLLPACQ